MIATGEQLTFGDSIVADKHCIGGVPGNRTTMILVPILAELGLKIPKTSSRAITSPAGTGDTMAVLADVALSPERLYRVVEEVGGCIAWGGALELAPADDILITVERPMEIDTEAQMVASILAKKKTAGATHVLIDIPVGSSAKVKTLEFAEHLSRVVQGRGRADRSAARDRDYPGARPDRLRHRAAIGSARRPFGPPMRTRCARRSARKVADARRTSAGNDRRRAGLARLRGGSPDTRFRRRSQKVRPNRGRAGTTRDAFRSAVGAETLRLDKPAGLRRSTAGKFRE